jgi:RHS repeat-associated protein
VQGNGRYRYGFNGKENDNEVKGEGNQQDYGMRIYDPRLGRFLSVDPLTKSYPHYTPYSYAGNKPIKFIDLDGAEEAKNWADYDFNKLMNWIGGHSPSDNPFNRENPIGTFSENLNPIHILNNYGCKLLYGKSMYGERLDYRGKTGVVTDLGTDVVLYLTGEKLFKVVLGPKNAIQVIEQQELKNEATLGATKPMATSPNPKLTGAQQLAVNNEVGKISEDIVENRLKAGLGTNEIIVKKPRFYIGKGEKYATPDFAIYNKDTKQFMKIIDAKNGGADFTKGQKQLNDLGGRFKGSSRYPEVKPQEIQPNMLTKEKTNITQ